MPTYLYDKGQGRFKHRWNHPYAGFEPSSSGQVGKCSSTIGQEVAQSLLDDGIPLKNDEDSSHPSAIYNVHEGIPYEAAPTEPGKSYHGFPWRGRMPEWILAKLQERAEASGHEREFKRWLKLHSEMHR